MKRLLILTAILLIVMIACVFPAGFGSPTPTPQPTSTLTTRLLSEDMYCPSDNAEAARAYNEGVDLQEEGMFTEARDAYLRAIELDPEYCDAMDNLGLLYRQNGDVEEAIHWYLRSLEVFPENTLAMQNLGLAYQVNGQYDDALTAYQCLMQVDPQNPEGYFGAGQVYLALEQNEDAIAMLEIADRLYGSGDYPEEYILDTRYLLGIAHYFLAEYVEARDYLEPLYDSLRYDPGTNYVLGECYLSAQIYDLELARTYILRARELGYDVPVETLERIGE